MNKRLTLGMVIATALPVALSAQISFTNASDLLSNTTTSGGCMGVVDMNGDGLDDICKLHNSRIFQVDYQNADGSFTLVNYGAVADEGQWGMSIGDISNDGHKDLICGGSYDGVHYLNITSPGVASLVDLNNGSMFMQCNNMADIDNDGHNDFFACHDDAAPRQWLNDGSGNLSYADIINYDTNPATDRSGNYGSVWTDFDNDGDLDFYIAHCRQGVNNNQDPRRWNRLFVNDGNGNYSDLAETYGVQIKNQSWTADFGDIDNDGDYDMVVTNHDATIQLFENDGTGHFSEITAGSGLEELGFFLQSKFVDFDNDGFVDILIAGGSGASFYFQNDGDQTFTEITGLMPANKDLHSFATGDLNNDGFQDVWANYGGGYINSDPANPDRLWLNDGNDNHWFSVRLQGVESNRDAIGARVTITGPWGTQIREVRAGESYGMVTSFACSFGLGQYDVIPTLTIRWPSGLVETFNDMTADQTITVIEGTCISPVATITPSGAPIICGNGDSVTLTANAGFEYMWSTGETGQSIEADAAGQYTVTIDDGSGCNGIASIFVQESPDETPTVTVEGDVMLCEGNVVMLTSSPAQGYMWTTGATTQSIEVSETGTYSVTIDGTCGDFTSADIEVEVLDSPEQPIADDVTIPVPGSAALMATGENNNWYDVAVGGTPIGTGPTFNTPVVSTNTPFWVASSIIHGGGTANGAKTNNDVANGVYHTNTDNYQFFESYEPFILRSVKVYANGAGNRTIALVDRSNGSTVASAAFNIPDGESFVQLDYTVPTAGDYALRCVGGNPQLWRDGLGSVQNYPYALGTLGAVTSSSVGGNNATAYYYFFYDWEVEALSTVCESPREEVMVFVGSVGVDEAADGSSVRLWPNPADEHLTISFGELSGPLAIDLMDLTGRIVMTRNADARAQGGMTVLDLNDLAQGEYLVRIVHSEGNSMHRVVLR